MIDYHETHDIIDSTKLDTYMRCPRKYFYAYMLGWQVDPPSHHLLAGSAIHKGMEHLLWRLHKDGEYHKDAADEAFEVFLADYREHFAEVDDNLRTPKDPASVRWMLDEYIKYYQADRFKVYYTEVAGAVPLTDSGHWIWFNIDAIVEDSLDFGKLKILDHKTTKYSKGWATYWSRGWDMTIQFGTYTHAAMCLFRDRFFGIVVNGLALASLPRVTASGEIHKQDIDKHPDFQRVNVQYAPDSLEAWYYDTLHTYHELVLDQARLANCKDNDPVMSAFPRRYGECKNFGGCPYYKICRASPNPLKQLDSVPLGYKKEFWNPKDRLDTAKAVYMFDPETKQATIEERADEA